MESKLGNMVIQVLGGATVGGATLLIAGENILAMVSRTCSIDPTCMIKVETEIGFAAGLFAIGLYRIFRRIVLNR